MGQIVRTKKKGRPSKADLAARRAAAAAEEAAEDEEQQQQQRDIRRSLRRRGNVRYNILDYEDDYLDDEEEFNDAEDEDRIEEEDEDEDEGERRREKKLKFVLKLPSSNFHDYHQRQRSRQSRGRGRPPRGGGNSAFRNRRAGPRPAGDSEEDDEEGTEQFEEAEEEEERAVKKRKISGGHGDDIIDYDENEDNEDKGNEVEPKRGDSVPGTPDETPSNTPMPEKKQLELILDKLQKKDTYAVYAEPVDPEELPDYHDIIEHPMDFATVRKKLAHGSYAILEEFESDVFLICSNAMQYNEPGTVYYKQARAIKELAERKFQRLRVHIERSLNEPKPEEKIPKAEEKLKPTPIVKKQAKKPVIRSTQESVGSDFSAGATLATADVNTAPNVVQAGSCERASNNDGHVEGISPLVDNNVEKIEDSSGKGQHLKFGKKSFVVDENRRATYDISNQAVDRSDSIFTTFENEQKQLIPVGVVGEHSYARSLARFAATLGPVAWSIASKRIEQAIPPGFKYGRGWVGEYEPVATSVLVHRSCNPKEQPLVTKVQSVSLSVKNNNLPMKTHSLGEHSDNGPGPDVSFHSGISKPPKPTCGNRPHSEGKSSSFGCGGSTPHTTSYDDEPRSDRKSSSLFGFGRSKPPAPGIDNGPRSGGKSSLSGSGGNTPHTPRYDNGPRQDSKPSSVSGSRGNTQHTPRYDNRPKQDGKQSSLSGSGQNTPHTPRYDNRPRQDGKPSSLFGSGGGNSPTFAGDSGLKLDGTPSSFIDSRGSKSSTPTGAVMQQRNPFSRSSLGSEAKVVRRPGSCSPSMMNQDTGVFWQNNTSSSPARPVETVMRNNSFLQPLPFKQPDMNSAVYGGLPNGKFMDNSVVTNQMVGSPISTLSPQLVGATACVSQRPDQSIHDPVQVMRMPTGNAQKQLNGSNISFGPSPVRPSVPSPRATNAGNTAATSFWMSAGAGGFKLTSENALNCGGRISADSLYSASRELHPPILQPETVFPASGTMHFQSEKKILPFQAFVPQPDRVSNEAQALNRPMFFPQPVTSDSPRFQAHSSPWRSLSSHTQHRQKQDTLPPDLNIAFQSSVDSQQPDLALQL